jgi:hypothetical protein
MLAAMAAQAHVACKAANREIKRETARDKCALKKVGSKLLLYHDDAALVSLQRCNKQGTHAADTVNKNM